MGDKTAIEWTDASWNPLRGCTPVSAGCDHCYAATLAWRYNGPGLAYEGLTEKVDGVARFNGRIMLVSEKLEEPLRWQRPRKIFVNSMSDLFHVSVPEAFVDSVFAVMALAHWHTFQVLTKRPQRMANYLNAPGVRQRIYEAAKVYMIDPRFCPPSGPSPLPLLDRWPFPNVWLGTSVENEKERHRIDALGNVPAAVRFLSCEPLLASLGVYLASTLDTNGIGWVIAGGESGPNFRPCDPVWVREIRDACQIAGVSYFFKQWGGQRPKEHGRLLDGREWSQYPGDTI